MKPEKIYPKKNTKKGLTEKEAMSLTLDQLEEEMTRLALAGGSLAEIIGNERQMNML